MDARDDLVDQYEDALFALLMDEVAMVEGERALELNKRLKMDPEAEVPERVQRRCEKVIH